MRPLIVAAVLAIATTTASGEDLLDCIDPTLRRDLLFWDGTESGPDVSERIPDSVAVLPVPAGFAWIASSVSDTLTIGAYKTSRAPAAALQSLLSGLADDGWTPPSFATGGSSAFERVRTETVCKNDDGIRISVWSRNDTTYVMLNPDTKPQSSICAFSKFRQGFGSSPAGYMPRFDFTSLDSGARQTGGSGGGSTGTVTEWHTQVKLKSNLANLANHLAGQLSEQGWQQDAGWSGSSTAGSTWFLETNNERVAGSLDVVSAGESTFDVAFSTKEWQ